MVTAAAIAEYSSPMSVIDDYVAGFTGPHHELMVELATLLRELVPEATEAFSYQMPTFKLNGNLVHFAAGENHVGLYPGPDGVEFAKDELTERGLKFSKGAIQFPLDQPLPRDLVTRIVSFRVQQQAKGR